MGVTTAVVAAKKWRELKDKPGVPGKIAHVAESVAQKAGEKAAVLGGAVWARASASAKEFVDEFRVASRMREAELAQSLLAETQGSEEDLRARRDAAASKRAASESRAAAQRARKSADKSGEPVVDEFEGDEDALGYQF